MYGNEKLGIANLIQELTDGGSKLSFWSKSYPKIEIL